MTEDQVKEVVFFTMIVVLGTAPLDTQLDEWEKARDKVYQEILSSLSFKPQQTN